MSDSTGATSTGGAHASRWNWLEEENMPTPTGLPRAGEVWERRFKLPPDWDEQLVRFRVIERGKGDYWSLRVQVLDPETNRPITRLGERRGGTLWVDASYWWGKGELTYVGNGTVFDQDAEPEGYLRRDDGSLMPVGNVATVTLSDEDVERLKDELREVQGVDHFAVDRAVLLGALERLGEAEVGVTCGEWAADHALGDPDLRDAIGFAMHASNLLLAADRMIRCAVEALPKPKEET